MANAIIFFLIENELKTLCLITTLFFVFFFKYLCRDTHFGFYFKVFSLKKFRKIYFFFSKT
jgi:hypothetical protein